MTEEVILDTPDDPDEDGDLSDAGDEAGGEPTDDDVTEGEPA